MSTLAAQPQGAEKKALDVAVTTVTHESTGLIRIAYVLTNEGSIDLYLPYVEIAGSIELTSLSLLHQNGGSAWVSVGPRFDVASYTPKILRPGASLSLIQEVSDPAQVVLPGAGGALSRQSIALHGINRIKIEYYSGETEWEGRLAGMKEQQQSSEIVARPQSEVTYSRQFEVPPAAK